MSWMNSLGAWQWLLLGSIPPLIFVLYFLKLRRQPLEVPSTFLWKRTIEDLHVNSIWQRLRQNLLLFLQLLFVALVILACLRPGLNGDQLTGRRWIFLIDNSASMQATDVSPSRLEVAKAKAREKLSTMNRGDVAMLLAFSDRADVKQGFTGDKRRLMAALDAIAPTNRTTDLSEALRAAAGLANPGRASFNNINDVQVADALPATIFLMTDGGFPPNADFDLGNLTAEYIPIGNPTADNVSILAFSIERNEEKPTQIEAFARLSNEGLEPVSVTASLYFNGSLLDAAQANIAPESESGVNFQLTDLQEGELRLEIDRPDNLMVDNVAVTALRPSRQTNLLVITPGNKALETAVATERIQKLSNVRVEAPEFMETPEYAKSNEDASYDMILYDQCSPKVMPNANTLFIGSSPPDPSWTFSEPQGPVFLDDWDKTHPMMQFLELGSVRVVEGRTVKPPESGSVLITADIGPVCSIAPRGPFQDAVLGFSLIKTTDTGAEVNTDWAIKRSFPVFVYSAIEFLSGGITAAAAQTVLPGQPMGLTLSNRYEQFQIQKPDGNRETVSRGQQSQLVFTQTELPGIYQVFVDGRESPVEMFAVNLFSARESNLDVVPELPLGAENVAASKAVTRGRSEFWRWLIAIGFLLLIAEWIVYNRRVLV